MNFTDCTVTKWISTAGQIPSGPQPNIQLHLHLWLFLPIERSDTSISKYLHSPPGGGPV